MSDMDEPDNLNEQQAPGAEQPDAGHSPLPEGDNNASASGNLLDPALVEGLRAADEAPLSSNLDDQIVINGEDMFGGNAAPSRAVEHASGVTDTAPEPLDAGDTAALEQPASESTAYEAWEEVPFTQEYLDNLPVRNADDTAVSPVEEYREKEPSAPEVSLRTAMPQAEVEQAQEKLEDVIAAHKNTLDTDSKNGLSQAELDAMIAAQQGATPEPAVQEDAGELSQAELDALIASQQHEEIPPKAASIEEKGTLSYVENDVPSDIEEDIPETLVIDDTGNDQTLSQEELDEVLSAQLAAEAEARGAPLEHASDTAAPESAARERSAILDQSELDALIHQARQAQAEKPPRPERVKKQDAEPPPDSLALKQDELDALLQSKGAAKTPDAAPEAAVPDDDAMEPLPEGVIAAEGAPSEPEDGAGISQDLIDSIIAAAQRGEDATAPAPREKKPPAAVASKAPAETNKGQLSQDELDMLLSQARAKDKERQQARQRALEQALSGAPQESEPAPEDAPVAELPPPKKKRHGPGVAALVGKAVSPLLRLAASLLIAASVGWGAYQYLDGRREITPPMDALLARGASDIALTTRRASKMIDEGYYGRAAAELERALEHASPGRNTQDARYLLIEARFKGAAQGYAFDEHQPVRALIDEVVREAPDHPRAPEALYWKAKLYEMDGIPYAAREIYEEIVDYHGDSPVVEPALLDAALLALALRDPPKAAQYAQRLLSRFPQSPHRAEARLLLADAYADSGMYDDARTLYVRVANEAGAAHEMWSEALLRLGRLAMAQRNYRDAINNLQLRLERTLSADGNDETHLLLGQAYQQMGRTDDAHRILSDMLAFFPHSPHRVEAMITLSQVCDQQGRRQEALRVAQQAASEFPDSHRALENKAELLGLTGNPYGAATALTAADAAGAENPALLLKAARYYKTAGALEDARATYTLLRQKYALSTDALTGGIELAVMMHNQGDTVEAARQLEELARATRGKPQHLQTLSAMADIYRDLGLRDALRDTATEIAALATAPEMLARAGMDLVKAGDVAAAERLAARLDFSRLRAQTAYTFLTRLGAALLEIDPARGLEKLEQAYLAYPESRAPKDAQPLLDAYLALDRSAQARRVVMELAAQWRDEPRYIAPFVDAAIGWGDYLMRRGDYRTAAEAYHLAIEAGSANTEALRDAKRHPIWAKFQRANALMALSDYDRSLELYTEVSASNTPWADEARIKAEQARLELQLRSAAYAGAQRES